MKRHSLRLVLLLAFLLVGATSPAKAWWDSTWTLRRKLTIDTSAATGAGPLGSGPILVRLYDGNFRFDAAKPDASDLRFLADDDKTLLSFHVEKFDPLLNEAFVWVKVPDLKPGTKTSFWLYYGNAGNKAVKVEDAKATYDDSMVLVYHFAEHGQAAFDSTGNGNNALNAGVATDGAEIGTGLRLDGHAPITVPASPTLAWANEATFTWSCWVKAAAPQANAVLVSRRATGKEVVIGVDNGVPFVEVRGGGSTERTAGGAPMAPGTWHHLAVVAGDRRVTLYLDGDNYSAAAASVPSLDVPIMVGGDASSTGFAGEIDEMELAKTAHSAAAIKLAAVSQGPDSATKFITSGIDEQQTGWLSAIKTGYFGVIIGSLSVDGWVVIGILGVMSIVSWGVMVGKAMYLNTAGKGNNQFLADWEKVATDLSVLENGNEPKGSPAEKAKLPGPRPGALRARAPLYHIYHIGVAEIQKRVSVDQTEAKILSARSIEAIRASLDAGLLREQQKLNSQMVLLTIAISGGPFLGLLGTVVGVMITFAAVAQAGDVNVNAIAPGIAAALAATVAGLAVAIPALFGYNYLLTRIKMTSTDMQVFIDEFITKLAEFYSHAEMEH